MLRLAGLTAIALMLTACGADTDVKETTQVAPDPEEKADTFIEYHGKRFELAVSGGCGAEPDGSYLTWAVSLDASGQPVPDDVHLYAMREAYWSVIDFYWPADDKIVRIYREGRERFGFEDGVLNFSGELGAGITDVATVRIVCPD